MIEDRFLNAMGIILSRLENLAHPWAVTGSLGLYMQGIDVDVNDIDLQSSKEGAFAIERALEGYVVHQVRYVESRKIRSFLGELNIGGIKVEIMGELQKKTPDNDWEPPDDISLFIHWVKVNELSIPVFDLEMEYRAYRMLGREEKAEKILSVLQEGKDTNLEI
jgi:hypothetical protein